jgi:hypothetical protein
LDCGNDKTTNFGKALRGGNKEIPSLVQPVYRASESVFLLGKVSIGALALIGEINVKHFLPCVPCLPGKHINLFS